MTALLGLILWSVGAPSVAQAEIPAVAPSPRPKMGIKVATPNGPRLLVGFSATGSLADLKAIEARMVELRCPPVLIKDAGESSRITAMFAETCDQDAAVAYVGEVLKNKYPSVRDTDVMILPVAEPAN